MSVHCYMVFLNSTFLPHFCPEGNMNHRILWRLSVGSSVQVALAHLQPLDSVSSQAFKTARHVLKQPVVLILDLSGQYTEEDKDEHSLESVSESK